MIKFFLSTVLTFLWFLSGALDAQLQAQPRTDAPPVVNRIQDQPSFTVREPMQPGPAGVGISLDVVPVEAKKIGTQFVYSVKYLCGRIPHSESDPQDPPLDFPLVPGTYRSAININNPNLSEASFSKQALTTNPQQQPRGKAGAPVTETLAPNEGLEVECQDIEGLLIAGGSGTDLANNTNTAAVFSSPPSPTTITLTEPAVIKQLVTYHWNGGAGDDPMVGTPPGTITLRGPGGTFTFAAHGTPGQGGAPNVNWVADANQLIPAGTYTVVDSRPQSWSYNQQSQFAGFAIVRGSYSFVGRAPFYKGFVVIRSAEQLDVVGVYTVKNVISAVPNPLAPAPPPPPIPGRLPVNLQPCHANSASFVELAKPVCSGPPGTTLTLYVSRAGLTAPPTMAVFKSGGPTNAPISTMLNGAVNLPGLPSAFTQPVIPVAGASLAPFTAYNVTIPAGACFAGAGRTWYFDIWVPGSGAVDEVGVKC